MALKEAPDAPAFVEPQPLAPDVILAEAQGHYEHRMELVVSLRRSANHAIDDADSKLTAFLLHQAVEHLYNGLLLTLTLYTPRSHNLVRLRTLAEQIAPSLIDVWPTQTKFQKRCFELLRAAYIKSRYARTYKVTAEELAWMRERIGLLQDRVIALCEARLDGVRTP